MGILCFNFEFVLIIYFIRKRNIHIFLNHLLLNIKLLEGASYVDAFFQVIYEFSHRNLLIIVLVKSFENDIHVSSCKLNSNFIFEEIIKFLFSNWETFIFIDLLMQVHNLYFFLNHVLKDLLFDIMNNLLICEHLLFFIVAQSFLGINSD